tara:strand:+ start:1328 stop:2344 length:1017 start_codon:yes stop_codon:yes gene_type:complete
MNIFFLERGKDKLGSNRIYINNLSFWISKLGIKVVKSKNIKKDFSHYILSKYSTIKDLKKIREVNKGKVICGLVHPSDLSKSNLDLINNVDFLICGSIEERDYYSYLNKPIIRFPQIERIKFRKKTHINKKNIVIGYHGNLEHLEEMDTLKYALERLNNKYKISLTVIYDKKLGRWNRGRPNIPIKEINWEFNKIIKEIPKFDIGIVPCTNNFFLDKPKINKNIISFLFKTFTGGKNKRTNDYVIRFKVTSNAGRSFIFHQLGIPVIADFWPSNFEILGNPKNGLLAHSEQGWYDSLEELINSAKKRQVMSNNAQTEFKKNYDPMLWAKNLINELSKL